jgi:hypothetical protein
MMPRDIHGKAVKSEAAEPIEYGASKDKESKTTERKGKLDADPEDMLQNHHDRLARIEEHLGLSKKADAYKDEDQGGKGKIGAGHVTEKAGAHYGRKRH